MSETAAQRVFSPVVVAWLLVAGVFAFSAYMVLSAFAPDLRTGFDGGSHALSRSAIGFAGLVRLLKAEDEVALVSRRAPPAQGPTPGLTVVTPSISSDGDALAKRVARGRVLIVLPKWNVVPDSKTLGWVAPFNVVDADQVQRLLKPALSTVTIGRRNDTAPLRLVRADAPTQGMTTAPIVYLQVIRAAAALRPVLTAASGEVVLASDADQRVYVLSDPDLLNTRGLRDLATARVASALVDRLKLGGGGGAVVFDVTLNGFDSPPNLLKLAFEPPFLGATLCLFAASLLMGLHAVSRFGAPKTEGRVLALGKQALADNSAALIRTARREPRMAARYLDLSRAAVIRALGAGRLPPDQVDAFLDRVAERLGARHRLTDLARAAMSATDRNQALDAARALHEWRLEMTREPH
ncbi:MAG TPA: DUF4350 domain-containing protein [Caulobacteraceae bacterium]|jgi:hypothetical protein